jgi:hypothetical protein
MSRRGEPRSWLLEAREDALLVLGVALETFVPLEPERVRTSAGSSARQRVDDGRGVAVAVRDLGAAHARDVRRRRSAGARATAGTGRRASTCSVRRSPCQGDQSLHVASGIDDSPDRNENTTSVPDGVSPSQRNAPKRLVRPVSLTGETYSPPARPAAR